MNNFFTFLEENPEGVLVTVDECRPRVRMFQFLWAEENEDRIFFATSNKKEVYNQIRSNPLVAFTSWNRSRVEVITVYGTAGFLENDAAAKSRAVNSNDLIREIYHSADNPDLVIMFINIHQVLSFDYLNEEQKLFSLE